jgi:DNA polymerase-3 subunit gamma/tau
MSYLVLARKYRPRNFGELVGQEHVVQALSNALTQGRLHHAYLFTGTRGVGKTTVSRILAKSLNCVGADGQGGVTATPCGVCHACRDIDAGRFVDYIELDAASNRTVEEITPLLDQAVYKPVVGRFKVYLIDEVHMLSTTAFNAMLKTLEEPPDYLKFVLATTDPQKVPATVLSRCLQFNLRPMGTRTVQDHLAQVLGAEGIDAEPAALRLLARAARGSMRDALSVTDQAIAFGGGAVRESAVRDMLGAVDRSHAIRLVEGLAAADGRTLVEEADRLRTLGLSAAGTLDELADLLQQMAVARSVPDALDADESTTPAALRLADQLDADQIQVIYSMALHGRSELALAPDEYSGLVMVLLRMLTFCAPPADGARAPTSGRVDRARAPVATTDAAVTSRPDAVRVTVSKAPVQVDPIEPAAPVPSATEPIPTSPSISAGEARDRWAEVVSSLVQAALVTAMARELALHAECIRIDQSSTPAVWVVQVERETLRSPANIEKLQLALGAFLGAAVKLEVGAGAVSDTPAMRAQAEAARRQAVAEQVIHDDPVVRTLLSQYAGARIVSGSIKVQ